jgi:ADP-ribose pyrophosphatase YjhB (NUDIX family)
MFSLTVSIVLIIDNGALLVKEGDIYKFPGGIVKAGQETIQFACVRYIKEQTGITLKKDSLIPVDFRSDPSRCKEGNIVDMGFVSILEKHLDITQIGNAKWKEIDFEHRKMIEKIDFYMDHDILLDRAIEVTTLMK